MDDALNHILVPVQHACEQVWKSQEPDRVISWLNLLHRALLRDRLETYDPSEAFLALQGAALRFSQPSFSKEESLSIWEESLWSAAALAKACVGPAWHHQLHQRRTWLVLRGYGRYRSLEHPSLFDNGWIPQPHTMAELTNIPAAPVEIIHAENTDSPRSFSPMTSSSYGGMSPRTEIWFPPIPEVLPAAMLRFASSVFDQIPASPASLSELNATTLSNRSVRSIMSITEAQRVLVLSLCCSSSDEHMQGEGSARKALGEWTLPAAHDSVALMVVFWLQIATTSRRDGSKAMDWEYTLQVSRAFTDLASAGWHPPASCVETVICDLFDIAERGLSLQELYAEKGVLLDDLSSSSSSSEENASKQARKECLAAYSSAGEVISSLAYLGSRGLLPVSCQDFIVRKLCRLLVLAGSPGELFPPPSSLRQNPDMECCVMEEPSSSPEMQEAELERDLCRTQRESCLADSADLLLDLLARPASAVTAMGGMLSVIEAANPSSSLTSSSSGGGDAATCVIRPLREWNRVKSVACQSAAVSIRTVSVALWGRLPDNGIPMLRIYWSEFLEKLRQLSRSLYSELVGDSDAETPQCRLDLLYLELDTIIAYGRVIDGDVAGGTGLLSVLEWEKFIWGLEDAIIPWLCCNDIVSTSAEGNADSGRNDQQHHVLERIRQEATSLLLRIGQFLQKCVRIEKSPFHLVVEYSLQERLYILLLRKAVPLFGSSKHREDLGTAVVRSWAKFGLFPYRLEGWSQTASALMSESFSMFDDQTYVHSPQVRLEALKSIVQDEAQMGRESTQNGENEELSLLGMTQHMRELHLEIIRLSLMPALKAVLLQSRDGQFPTLQRMGIPQVINTDRNAHEQQKQNAGETVSVQLECFAIALAGRLFRGVSGKRTHRLLFVEMLRDAALEDSWNRLKQYAPEISSGIFSIQREAVHQLELCLQAPFCHLPHAHESVPHIVDALSCILKKTVACGSEADSLKLLAISSLIPLARIRCSHDDKLALIAKSIAIKGMPHALSSQVTDTGCEYCHHNSSSMSSMFLRVARTGKQQSELVPAERSERTFLSLKPILSSIFAVLRAVHERTERGNNFLDDCLRAMCFGALSALLKSGGPVVLPPIVDEVLITSCVIPSPAEAQSSASVEGLLSRAKALASVAQCALAIFAIEGSSASFVCEQASSRDQAEAALSALLEVCESPINDVAIIGCRSLSAILSYRKALGLLVIRRTSATARIYAYIVGRLGAVLPELSSEVSNLTLAASLIHLLGESISHPLPSLPSDVPVFIRAFELCLMVIKASMHLLPCPCFEPGLRCAVVAVDNMTSDDIVHAEAMLQKMMQPLPMTSMQEMPSNRVSNEVVCCILSQILEQRRQIITGRDNTLTDAFPIPLSLHESLALEAENIERFEVEDLQLCPGLPRAAWFCGKDVLLSCRIGASSSRYRGWIELTVRRATVRNRVLIRLPEAVSLENPEFPCVLWPPKPLAQHLGTVTGRAELRKRQCFDNTFSDALEKAQELIDKFDSRNRSPGKCEAASGAVSKAQQIIERFDSVTLRHGHEEARAVGENAGATDEDIGATDAESLTESLWDHSSTAVERGTTSLSEAVASERSNLSTEPRSTPQEKAKPATNPQGIYQWLSSVLGDKDGIFDAVYAAIDKLLPCYADKVTGAGTPSQMWDGNYMTRLEHGGKLTRATSVFDRVNAFTTHKIALLYIGSPDVDITSVEGMLLNTAKCSPAFHSFAEGLGSMILTRHLKYFSGGLDVSAYEADGRFTRVWIEEKNSGLQCATNVVVFHVVNLMPEGLNTRKRHVGNDNVLIVFADARSSLSEDVRLTDGDSNYSVVSGEFGFVTIVVTLLPQPDFVRVILKLRRGLPQALQEVLVGLVGDDVVALREAPEFVRGLAVRADLTCRAMTDYLEPPINCLERYWQLQEMKRFQLKP